MKTLDTRLFAAELTTAPSALFRARCSRRAVVGLAGFVGQHFRLQLAQRVLRCALLRLLLARAGRGGEGAAVQHGADLEDADVVGALGGEELVGRRAEAELLRVELEERLVVGRGAAGAAAAADQVAEL